VRVAGAGDSSVADTGITGEGSLLSSGVDRPATAAPDYDLRERYERRSTTLADSSCPARLDHADEIVRGEEPSRREQAGLPLGTWAV